METVYHIVKGSHIPTRTMTGTNTKPHFGYFFVIVLVSENYVMYDGFSGHQS